MTQRCKVARSGLVALASFLSALVSFELLRLIWATLSPSSAFYFPPTFKIGEALIYLIRSPEFLIATGGTLLRVLISSLLCLAVGAAVGSVLGLVPWLYSLARPVWDFLRSIPPSVLFPLIVLVVGFGVASKVLTAAGTSALILSLAVADSIRSIDRRRIDFYRSLGATKARILFVVVLPDMMFRSWSAMRIVASLIVALVIITEMFLGARVGLGGKVIEYSETMRFPQLYAAIVVAGVIGFIVNSGVERFEKLSDTLRKGE